MRQNPWGAENPDPLRTHIYQGETPNLKAVMASGQDVTSGTEIYDMLGNAREWTVTTHVMDNCPAGGSGDWLLSYRTIKGLPPEGKKPASFPIEGAAFRAFYCATGACLKNIKKEKKSSYIGFRCVRKPPPEALKRRY